MKVLGWKNLPLLAVATLVALVGCGKTATYQKQDYSATATAGQYTKPKIDILVFQDNSASMISPLGQIKPQLDSFLSGIDSGWDYRFVVLPLQSVLSLNSKYVMAKDCSSLNYGTCLDSSYISYFNSVNGNSAWINQFDTSVGSTDLGFQTMKSNIQQSTISGLNGFIRFDAALAVIVISNGEDVSGVTYWDPDGDGTPTINYGSSTSIASLNDFTNYLSTVKGGSSLLRFYPVVATGSSGGMRSCYGSNVFVGYRYMQAATTLGSQSYDLCSGGISSVMNNIGSQINGMIQAIVFNYVVVQDEPMESSIHIKKNGVEIPHSALNGWTYEGYKTDYYTSYLPQLGNKKTGYFIRMNGTAAYKGTDLISIDYQRN